MSYKFVTNSQDGNEGSSTMDISTIAMDERTRQRKSIDFERPFQSKGFRVFYFTLSTLTLISGIVCLIVATQIRCEDQVSEKDDDNKQAYMNVPAGRNDDAYKDENLQEMKVFSPPIPRTLNISFATGPGHVFVFMGRPLGIGRWHIDFVGSKATNMATHFHFNPRHSEQKIVRNTKIDGVWGTEERDLCFKSFPFKKGQLFEVKIIVEETTFITYVDGEHYFDFAPALPDPSDIHFITVIGHVNIRNVTVFEQIKNQ